jgi:hypothetical protein
VTNHQCIESENAARVTCVTAPQRIESHNNEYEGCQRELKELNQNLDKSKSGKAKSELNIRLLTKKRIKPDSDVTTLDLQRLDFLTQPMVCIYRRLSTGCQALNATFIIRIATPALII